MPTWSLDRNCAPGNPSSCARRPFDTFTPIHVCEGDVEEMWT
jgi:hypothetical protein